MSRFQNGWHSMLDLTHQCVGWHGDDRKRSLPFSCVRIAPVLPQARQAEGRTVLHVNSVRLLGPRALNSPPFEEAVDRHDAAPLSISFAKCGELGNALTFREAYAKRQIGRAHV